MEGANVGHIIRKIRRTHKEAYAGHIRRHTQDTYYTQDTYDGGIRKTHTEAYAGHTQRHTEDT